MELPSEFRRRTVEVNGDAGANLLVQLPALLKECALSWGLALPGPRQLIQ